MSRRAHHPDPPWTAFCKKAKPNAKVVSYKEGSIESYFLKSSCHWKEHARSLVLKDGEKSWKDATKLGGKNLISQEERCVLSLGVLVSLMFF
jgi:hypothetical protein